MGTNITATKASRKLGGCTPPPHICHSGRYNRYKQRHTESLSDSVKKVTIFTAAFRFSSSTEFKMLDCMSNVQCHCSSKLYRKQNFQVLKPNVNCVTFAARPAVVYPQMYNVDCVVPPAGYRYRPQKWGGIGRTPTRPGGAAHVHKVV